MIVAGLLYACTSSVSPERQDPLGAANLDTGHHATQAIPARLQIGVR